MTRARFTPVTSHVTPLPIKDVDTDMIIPAQYLTSIERTGFGTHLFSRLRTVQPELALNQARFHGSEILLCDSNFGCGSSREHAVWALMGAGFRVVIAKSFADIFTSNSAKNGLLLVSLPAEEIDSLLHQAEHSTLTLTVDLASQEVRATDTRTWSFEYDPFRKRCLLEGLDDLEYLRTHFASIATRRAELDVDTFFDARVPNHTNSGSVS